MAELAKSLDGPQRAAVFLLSLGEQAASEILRHMGPREVQQVGTAMAGLSEVSNQQLELVVKEFAESVQERTSVGVGSEQYIRNIMVSALGEDKARSVLGSILMGRDSRGLESLRWMEPRMVSDLIKNEHPQIIAIVLSYLDSDQAANVLSTLPANVRTDVIMRIVNLDTVNPAAIEELDEIIEKQFSVETSSQSSRIGGLKAAADIINFLDTPVETELLESIDAEDSGMSEKIRDQLFVFENLVSVDDRGMQRLLRDVPSDSLLIALKGADETVREKIFNNMSKRAAEMLREDLETKGPVRLTEVEAAQKSILAVANRLAESGDIVLGGRGGDDFV